MQSFAPLTVAFGLAVLLSSCASSQIVKTAALGDSRALKREVTEAQKQGTLDEATVRDLARAVLTREISAARGADAPSLMASLSGCAGAVSSPLQARAQGRDDVAAAAQLLLFRLGDLDPEEAVAKFGRADEGAFRAIAAEATTDTDTAQLRRDFLIDPDPRVRQGALRAAIAAKDPKDTELLFESSRVDPEPSCRGLALRALGQLGGERVVNALQDRFSQGNETTRMAIAEAWALPASRAAGGELRLVWVAESQDGLPAITAAVGLLRSTLKVRETGVAVLLRMLEQGTPSERRLVVQVAPLSVSVLSQAMRTTSLKDPEPAIRALALRRLLSQPGDTSAVKRSLSLLLRRTDEAALIAEQALAAHGDASVVPALVTRLQKKNVDHRLLAALALLDLERYSDAAIALADDHARVRASVACRLLNPQ